MTDAFVILGCALALGVVLVFQRWYTTRLRRRARLEDRLWAQVLDDMKSRNKLR